jgi:hypothetical protein
MNPLGTLKPVTTLMSKETTYPILVGVLASNPANSIKLVDTSKNSNLHA